MRGLARFLALVLVASACGGGSAVDFCAEAARLDQIDAALEGAGGEEAARTIRESMDRLERSAPSEIQEDMRILAQAFRDFADWAEQGDLSAPFPASLEDPRVEQAGERVERYVEEECGIDTDGEDAAEDEVILPGEDDDALDEEATGEDDTVSGPPEIFATYRVTGAISDDVTEPGATFCSLEGGAGGFELLAGGVGGWTLNVAAGSDQEGVALEAEFRLTPPPDAELVGDDSIFDHIFEGSGSVTFQSAGEIEGFPILAGTFSAPGLTSDAGHTVDLEGSFQCESF